jgi:hypothetical protein
MNYKIVDNFLTEEEFVGITNIVFSSNFPWYTDTNGIGNRHDLTDKYFTHNFYRNLQPHSNYFYLLNPIFNKLGDVNAIVKAKTNMYMRNAQLIHHAQHIDFPFEHKGFMLYLNTNDGFTELEDGTQVQSIANRGLFFTPHKPHNSTNCTDALSRTNIAINYF